MADQLPQKRDSGSSRRDAAAMTRQRLVALVGQAFDELEQRRKQGKGDVVAVLADQILEDPMTALERLGIQLRADEQPGSNGGLSFNIKELYLAATQTANGHAPALPAIEGEIVETEAGTSGVHEVAEPW